MLKLLMKPQRVQKPRISGRRIIAALIAKERAAIAARKAA